MSDGFVFNITEWLHAQRVLFEGGPLSGQPCQATLHEGKGMALRVPDGRWAHYDRIGNIMLFMGYAP